MAKKYVNFRVGGVPETKEDNYTVWTNDLLSKLIASKTVIEPSKSTFGHRLLESEVIFVVVSGRGIMEVVEYANTSDGHGHDPSLMGLCTRTNTLYQLEMSYLLKKVITLKSQTKVIMIS